MMLVELAKRVCEPGFLDTQFLHLEEALKSTGYPAVEMRTVRPRRFGGSDESVSQTFVGSAVLALSGVCRTALGGYSLDDPSRRSS